MKTEIVSLAEVKANGGELAAEEYLGGPVACARCGFAPRSGAPSNLIEPSSRGWRCINRKACEGRKARRHG